MAPEGEGPVWSHRQGITLHLLPVISHSSVSLVNVVSLLLDVLQTPPEGMVNR